MRVGTPTRARRILPYLRPSLIDALLDLKVKPIEAPRVFHGKRVARPERNPGEDQLILEIRRMYEQDLAPLPEIVLRVSQLGYTRTKSWVHQTTQYHNRAHLIPTEGAAPYLKVAV